MVQKTKLSYETKQERETFEEFLKKLSVVDFNDRGLDK